MYLCHRAAALAALLALPLDAQDYRSSVVGTDFDFIREEDPNLFSCLEYKGFLEREMPDKTSSGRLLQQAFVFVSYFDDGTSVDMALDADFGSEQAARAEAERYVRRLGRLPTSLRGGVQRMVVHYGNEDATAFSDIGLIVLYSDNATKRISTHDLEETLFHESVHASWDHLHRSSPAWLAAQEADGTFVTEYASEHPDREDLAESALFAYTLVHHPERIPAPDGGRIAAAIPARIAFVETLLPPDEPIFYQVAPKYPCDGSRAVYGQAGCTADLTRVGVLADVLSNALNRGLDMEEHDVRALLDDASDRYPNADALMEAAALEFGIDRETLDAEVERYRHCNCGHDELDDLPVAPAAPTGGPTPTADAPASPTADAPASPTAELRPLLFSIACLLALLLAVNVSTLFLVVRRSATRAPG